MFSKIKTIIRSRLIPDRLFLMSKPSDEKSLYLTFDDGPVPGVIEPLLDLLEKYQVKATFFIIGHCAQKHPELLEKIHQQQHTIANHSYSHPNFNAISRSEKMREVNKTNFLIKEITGVNCTLFRVPQGRWNIRLILDLFWQNIIPVHWSRDSMDYMKEKPNKIIDQFNTKPVTTGDIVLFHDDDKRCIEVLNTLIPMWQSQGIKFNTLDNNS